ncbi:VOC family protein [Falsiroseomonas tokyonensis]|uniref:VOC family protein n=1 Tax=Falsiroseomonas tokyonensis TaxID=430521 RepID=A0ABV7BRJ3_9PROT|nr:VOC family protein [Falsiroseomonas tokyonensis]MBU8536693.1 VOC family protein [Falsiroseomonas tokyonensis]
MTAATAITFFYYADLAAVIPFYEETLGFELLVDQGSARIYRIAPNCHFGIVDGNRGHLRHQPRSAALLTLVVADVAAWHARLMAAGVPKLGPLQRGPHLEHFFFEDPTGYALEIQRFQNPEVAKLFA